MSEIDRLYRYTTLLSTRRALPRDVILKELEISPATFKRDIAKLRDRLHMVKLQRADNHSSCATVLNGSAMRRGATSAATQWLSGKSRMSFAE